MSEKPCITVLKDGPYEVTGNVKLCEDAVVPSADKTHLQYNHVRDFDTPETYHLCRCGASKNKPFCDGSHKEINFDGTEVADRTPYDQRVDAYEGNSLKLLDDNRCAFARFCHRKDGDVWSLTEEADGGQLKQEAVAASWHCPAGRLEHHNKETGEVYEQEFDPSIVVLQDVERGVSSPLFVRGGVALVSADGFEYEKRNRYALCRCGQSENKPFCNAMHVTVGFDDGSPALRGTWQGCDESFDEVPEVE